MKRIELLLIAGLIIGCAAAFYHWHQDVDVHCTIGNIEASGNVSVQCHD